MRSCVLIVACALGGSSACSPFNTLTYINSVNELLECLDVTGDISFSDFSTMMSGKATLCGPQSDRASCEAQMRDFVESNPNSVLASVVNKLLESPASACPCVRTASASLDDCIPAIDDYVAYCNILGNEDAHSTDCSIAVLDVCGDMVSSGTYEGVVMCLEVLPGSHEL